MREKEARERERERVREIERVRERAQARERRGRKTPSWRCWLGRVAATLAGLEKIAHMREGQDKRDT